MYATKNFSSQVDHVQTLDFVRSADSRYHNVRNLSTAIWLDTRKKVVDIELKEQLEKVRVDQVVDVYNLPHHDCSASVLAGEIAGFTFQMACVTEIDLCLVVHMDY